MSSYIQINVFEYSNRIDDLEFEFYLPPSSLLSTLKNFVGSVPVRCELADQQVVLMAQNENVLPLCHFAS